MKLLEKFYSSKIILYDQLLFLIEIINKENKNEIFIQHYFIIINKLLNNIINKIDTINILESNEFSYEFHLLSKIMNILYSYYCDKLTNKGNSSEIIINEKINIPNNFHESMKKLIKINLNSFF